MLSFERQEIILDILKKNKNISIVELSKQLNASLNTIRTDLENMEKEGLVIRVRGGVSLPSSNISSTNNNIGLRYQRNLNEKRIIAREVIKDLPNDKDFSIFMDSSTSAMQVAYAMAELPKRCTVITHFTNIAHILSVNPRISVILCGGIWWANENCVIGPEAVFMLDSYRADISIIGCTSIKIAEGLFNVNIETVPVKKKMIDNSNKTWLVCDSSKFGQSSLVKIASFKEINRIYTDKAPSEEWIEYFTSINLDLHYPKK